jgi:DNA-binding transcriptional regulator YiaG
VNPAELRNLRKRLGLTQSKFADLLGIHKVSLARMEAGTRGMSATTKRLLRLLAERGQRALALPATARPKSPRRRRRNETQEPRDR